MSDEVQTEVTPETAWTDTETEVTTIEETKQELAEAYLNFLDQQKWGMLATSAGLGVSLNPLQKDAIKYLTTATKKEKTDIFATIGKNIKKKFIEKITWWTLLEYNKTSLNKMKALITQYKDNQAKLQELMVQIQEGTDPTTITETTKPTESTPTSTTATTETTPIVTPAAVAVVWAGAVAVSHNSRKTWEALVSTGHQAVEGVPLPFPTKLNFLEGKYNNHIMYGKSAKGSTIPEKEIKSFEKELAEEWDKWSWTVVNLKTGKTIANKDFGPGAKLDKDGNYWGASVVKLYCVAAVYAFYGAKGETPPDEDVALMSKMITVSNNPAWKKINDKYKTQITAFVKDQGLDIGNANPLIWVNRINTPSVLRLYDLIYKNKFPGADKVLEHIAACQTLQWRAAKYIPKNFIVGGKTGTRPSGSCPIKADTGILYNQDTGDAYSFVIAATKSASGINMARAMGKIYNESIA